MGGKRGLSCVKWSRGKKGRLAASSIGCVCSVKMQKFPMKVLDNDNDDNGNDNSINNDDAKNDKHCK